MIDLEVVRDALDQIGVHGLAVSLWTSGDEIEIYIHDGTVGIHGPTESILTAIRWAGPPSAASPDPSSSG